MLSSFLNTVNFLLSHPLTRRQKMAAIQRFIRWQVGSRILPGAVAIPFVNGSRLLMSPGMTGATGNLYCGLHEFEDMAFLLHVLRPGDLFIDVGANVGSYSILAASAGAKVIAFEPIPTTFRKFLDNIGLNHFESLISPRNQGVGESYGTLRFTSGLDTINHVATETDTTESIKVEVMPLDSLSAENQGPVIIKIDVEGFEMSVIKGAVHIFNNPNLLAVLMELNGNGRRYGIEDDDLHSRMLSLGFTPYCYEPFERKLIPLSGKNSSQNTSDNTLYIKQRELVAERINDAPKVSVNGVSF
jgi:FkbM family methyltransferase